MVWKPIESAPKDETFILLYSDMYGEPDVRSGFWSEDDGGDWYGSESASVPLTAFGWQPTHWAPFQKPEA